MSALCAKSRKAAADLQIRGVHFQAQALRNRIYSSQGEIVFLGNRTEATCAMAARALYFNPHSGATAAAEAHSVKTERASPSSRSIWAAIRGGNKTWITPPPAPWRGAVLSLGRWWSTAPIATAAAELIQYTRSNQRGPAAAGLDLLYCPGLP